MEIRCVYTEGNQNVIQEAVDRLPASGGTVIVPRGEWKSGAIHLKSNVKLYLEEGCVIHFSSCMEDYLPPVFTRWEGVECYNYSPLIYAADCENVTICGTGVLDGAGSAWWHWKKLQQNAADHLIRAESQGIAVEERVFATREDALRPSFIQFINCKHVTLEDFTIEDGPQWTIHPVYCEDVVVRGVTVNTKGPNTDGCNPDSCRKVLIEDCTFDTGDDCIAINSGMNEDGWRVGRPCEQIEVKNCRFIGGHAAVAIGSGMSGGICDIWIHDCVARGTERGIRIKSMRGRGGYVKRVNVERMQMDEIEKEAIEVSMNYGSSTAVPVSQKAPEFSELRFAHIRGNHAAVGVSLCGLPESPLREITLEDVSIAAEDPLREEYVDKYNTFSRGSCAYERLTFRRFGANLRKVDTHKHEEEESTSADTLQRDFQLRGRSLLRGNEEGRMEDGFGVAGLNTGRY